MGGEVVVWHKTRRPTSRIRGLWEETGQKGASVYEKVELDKKYHGWLRSTKLGNEDIQQIETILRTEDHIWATNPLVRERYSRLRV